MSDIDCKTKADQALFNRLVDEQIKRIEDLARESDKRYEQRFQAQEAATTRAQEVGNEFRGSLDDLSLTKMPRTEADQRNRSVSEKLDSLDRRVTELLKPNWQLWLTALGIFILLVGAAYKITDLQTQVSISPINAQNQVSITDRSEMHSEIVLLRNGIQETFSDIKANTQKLREVETQFKAANDITNAHFAEQQRMNNVMCQMTKSGLQYPSAPYYFPRETK